MKKRISIFLILIVLLVGFVVVKGVIQARRPREPASPFNGETGRNVWGWAWSENIGWISFNCINQETCENVDYGVNINPDDGLFSGYAWSENIGWISFNSGDLAGCPEGDCSAKLDLGTNEVSGWARACAVFANGCSGALNPNRGGWDGWIKLRGLIGSGGTYGAQLNRSGEPPYEFEEWTWGGGDTEGEAVTGWVSFNCLNTGICGTSDYKVMTNLAITPPNEPPEAKNLKMTEGDYCFKNSPPIYLNWTFSDPDSGDTQSAYQIQIDTSRRFPDPFDTGKMPSPSNTYTPPPGPPDGLLFGTNYYWRVKVWDSHDASSDWAMHFFGTRDRPPWPEFTWSPENPAVGKDIIFDNDTEYCIHSCSYSWDFDDSTPIDNSENPTHSYSTEGEYSVSLTASSHNGSCTVSHTVNVGRTSPEWEEIPPTF